MAKKDYVETTAVVKTALPNAKFLIELENGHTITGHISGKIRKNNIRIQPGDKVKCEVSVYDMTKARITFRMKNK